MIFTTGNRLYGGQPHHVEALAATRASTHFPSPFEAGPYHLHTEIVGTRLFTFRLGSDPRRVSRLLHSARDPTLGIGFPG